MKIDTLKSKVFERYADFHQQAFLLLRIACFMEFVGHGAFGVMTKRGWLPFFEVFGIPEFFAWKIMPVVGAVDILLGISMLIWPCRAVALWMAFWGTFTALLRPLAGFGWWEFIERSYNYMLPFCLFLLMGIPKRKKDWIEKVKDIEEACKPEKLKWLFPYLQVLIALCLIGHAGFGLVMDKANLIQMYDAVGLTSVISNPTQLNQFIGSIELFLGILILLKPKIPVLITILVWKLGTEMLYPIAGFYGGWFEVIERGSCYLAILLLILFIRFKRGEPQS